MVLMQNNHVPIITLDGPSGTGKGTISLMLAHRLKWNYLDSGALYRVLAYAVDKNKLKLDNLENIINLARTLHLSFKIDDHNATHVLLDDCDITREIRSEDCGLKASILASNNQVRQALLDRQRQFAKKPGLVTDGRDMGTVVFPNADVKIFLYASPEERAQRRYHQLKEKGNNVSLAQVVEDLKNRDERDTNRTHSPLQPAQDSIQIDTTRLEIAQVFDHVLQLITERLHIIN